MRHGATDEVGRERPILVSAGMTLREVAVVLHNCRVAAALVVDGDRGLTGLVSEHDIVAALADGADPDLVWAADVADIESLGAALDGFLAGAVA